MEPVRFGRTGLHVSPLCLGTMTFGTQADEAESHRILDTALESGISFIDTADSYPLGQEGELAGLTEEVIGRWLGPHRNDVILASKFFFPIGSNPWDRGGSRKHIMDAIEGSLRRLQTDYLDLFQIHFFDSHTPIDETLTALDDLVRSGKVRYVGCSNFAAWQISRAVGRSEVLGVSRFESVQPRYNLLFRNIERDILPAADYDQLAVIPYNPLAGGLLTDKHRTAGPASAPPAGGRFDEATAGDMYRKRYWKDDNLQIVAEAGMIADEVGVSLATLAIAWVMANPTVTAPIIGASRTAQLADSISAVGLTLPSEVMERLDVLTRHYRTVDLDR
ncbi:MAG: aryl-alcohol dehydrogenase-like predicted oxidoreductase [Verrucomicrobiales bacterium]|jgi:aryl-alcohol dehydrogenase-like predicted oxidoreductase